jgi:hypothetical protein
MDKYRPSPFNVAAFMAGIALGIGRHVVRCLAKRIGKKEVATVTARAVTRSNRPGRTGMAHRYARTEAGKGAVAVAGIALSGRWNMRGRLAECRRTVVAG